MTQKQYHLLSELIEKNLSSHKYKKIDDLMVDCWINKKSKKADDFMSILEDMREIRKVVFCGNEIILAQ